MVGSCFLERPCDDVDLSNPRFWPTLTHIGRTWLFNREVSCRFHDRTQKPLSVTRHIGLFCSTASPVTAGEKYREGAETIRQDFADQHHRYRYIYTRRS